MGIPLPAGNTLLETIYKHFNALSVAFGAAWQRGRDLADAGAVLRIGYRDAGEVRATVRGTRGNVYQTKVFVYEAGSDAESVLSDCSCPIGIDCKHAAALIHFLLRQSLPASEVTPAPAAAAARNDAPSPWLALAERGQLPTADSAAREASQLLVLVRLDSAGNAMFRPVRARLGKNGRWAHVRKIDLGAPRILQTVHGWAMRERLAALVLMAFDGFDYPDEEPWLTFAGPVDAMFTQLFALTIELRFEQANGVILRAGSPRQLESEWRVAASGNQFLALTAQPLATPIANAGYRLYLDPRNGEVGNLPCAVPIVAIAAISAMPSVEPDETGSAQRALDRLFPQQALPRPQALTIVEAAPTLPKAIVLIGGAPYMNRPDLLTQATAHLGFRYGQNEVRAGDAAAELRWRGEDGRIHVLARDLQAEARAAEFLRRHGFRPGSVHGHGPLAEHWYWSGRLKDSELLRWVADLRRDALGNQIELRSTDEFPIALEPEVGELDLHVDADGNDWFSLRLGIEVDGQPIDLVPVLLEALSKPEELRPEGLRLT